MPLSVDLYTYYHTTSLALLAFYSIHHSMCDMYLYKRNLFFCPFLVLDCYRRERVGFKHFFTALRETVSVADVAACNAACQKASYCLSFSYR